MKNKKKKNLNIVISESKLIIIRKNKTTSIQVGGKLDKSDWSKDQIHFKIEI